MKGVSTWAASGFLLLLLAGTIPQGSCSSSLPRFKSGRHSHGFVPPPPPVPEGKALPEEEWFTQIVDHFNPTDERTFQQKFFTNGEYYQEGGPVFLMIGGEGPAGASWLVGGSWIDYAQKLNAYLIQVEHRYYGDSQPTEDMSSDNLAQLSSEQALADLAHFTVVKGEELGLKDNKWVSFGGSYAGSLSAWYRLKYPHLVHAAVATSAPMIAQVDFKEYFEVVRDSLATVDEQCNINIKGANDQVEELLKDEAGWQQITEGFNLCSPLDGTNEDDVSNFFELLADNFAGVVQYNDPLDPMNINVVCDIMLDETLGDNLARLQEVNRVMMEYYGESCSEHRYDVFVSALQEESWLSYDASSRLWFYQTCTEYGWYQDSDSEEQPFAHKFPLDFFIDWCVDIYGPKFTSELLYAGVDRTNFMYGGLTPSVTRVVFPNGSIDPWHAVSILSDLSADAPAIYINGTSHCANMYTPKPGDPQALTDANNQIYDLIEKWLQEE